MNADKNPLELSLPLELTAANIDRIGDLKLGIIVISKFSQITKAGALAIEAGNIKQLLSEMSRSYESSFFFRYRIAESEGDALLIRDLLRSVIGVHKLGE